MGTVKIIEETSYDCWVLYDQKHEKEEGEFSSYEEAKAYLLEDQYMINRGFLPAQKKITYAVHDLD